MKQKKKMTSTGFLLLITIVLFFVMYAAGMVIFADKGFAKPQMFLNLFVSNAGLLVISCGLTIVMITGGIDISVGSGMALGSVIFSFIVKAGGNPAAALAGAAVVVWLVSRRLTHPLTVLTAASARIAAGDYALRTRMHTGDELEILSQGFDQMAGGMAFRHTAGDRMRYKVLHKFHDYKARFKDYHMCVGCGRCIAKCPISMNIVKVEKALEVEA